MNMNSVSLAMKPSMIAIKMQAGIASLLVRRNNMSDGQRISTKTVSQLTTNKKDVAQMGSMSGRLSRELAVSNAG